VERSPPTLVPPNPEIKTEAKRAGPSLVMSPAQPSGVKRRTLPSGLPPSPDGKGDLLAERAAPILDTPPVQPTTVMRNILEGRLKAGRAVPTFNPPVPPAGMMRRMFARD
jgi:hypothetical protein